jgi:hypothetical protein
MLNLLRRYKIFYSLYNYFKKEELKHNIPLYKKYGIKKKYYSPVSSEDFIGMESPANTYDRLDSREALPEKQEFRELDKKVQEELLPWSEKGYVILKKFFSDQKIDAVNAEVDRLIKSNRVKFKWGTKIMFAIKKSQLLYDFGSSARLMKILSLLMDKPVQLFQSINFLTGSQQKTHSDSFHMTTFPKGNLIAIWVALEDISADSGPLHYYPRSHKLPYIMNRDYDNVGTEYKLGSKTYADYTDRIEEEIEKRNLKKEVFLAEKGDVLIWHANLLHGGEPVQNEKSTRKSMVFHYYTEDAICFHEITQRPSLRTSVEPG